MDRTVKDGTGTGIVSNAFFTWFALDFLEEDEEEEFNKKNKTPIIAIIIPIDAGELAAAAEETIFCFFFKL